MVVVLVLTLVVLALSLGDMVLIILRMDNIKNSMLSANINRNYNALIAATEINVKHYILHRDVRFYKYANE